MNMNSTKQLLGWWFLAFAGFVVVRLALGQSLDTRDVVGGIIVQLVLVTVLFAGLALIKRIRAKKATGK